MHELEIHAYNQMRGMHATVRRLFMMEPSTALRIQFLPRWLSCLFCSGASRDLAPFQRWPRAQFYCGYKAVLACCVAVAVGKLLQVLNCATELSTTPFLL